MIDSELLVSFALIFFTAFLLTYAITPVIAKKIFVRGLTGRDMNKPEKPEVAELGGISIILGVSIGIITALFLATYVDSIELNLTILLASFITILLVGFIGVIDDLIGWKKGIRQYQHALFPLFAALPLMALQAGASTISLPFFGVVSIGILYSLILVPLGITGAANAFNMLAGMNGLEAGMGTIILSTLTLIAYLTGYTEAAILGVAIVASLLAFLKYNWFPAKVFGGDSLTLLVGASIATISIIGNMEKIGIMIIALYWVELFFKAKTRFQAESFGIPQKNGVLKAPEKIGSLTHFILKIKPMSEKQLVKTILGLQLVISAIVFLLHYNALL